MREALTVICSSGLMRAPDYNTVYVCRLSTLGLIHYASVEIGRHVHVLPYLHNYALSYALFLTDSSPIELQAERISKPTYEEDLKKLREQSLYVTPAFPIRCSTSLHVWGAKSEEITHKEEKVSENYPPSRVSYEGINPNSEFLFFVFSAEHLHLPSIIRIGKKRETARVKSQEAHLSRFQSADQYTSVLLTPWDLPMDTEITSFSRLIFMPPCKLLEGAKWRAKEVLVVEHEKKYFFPPMAYGARAQRN